MKYFLLSIVALLLLPPVITAQQPVAGPVLWLKADQGVLTDSLVYQWSDAAVPSRKAVMTVGANKPALIPNAINNLPAVRFGGTQYMIAPSVYPVGSDYVLFYIVRLNNLSATNNIVSGTTHAVYYNPPRLLHGNFNTLAVSSTPLDTKAALVTVRYTQSNQTASVSVNGSVEETAFVGANADSTIYLGAYQQGNFMNGDLAEVILYGRDLNPSEIRQTEDYLLQRYALQRLISPATDSIFTSIPQQAQFFPRDAQNGADLRIAGQLYGQGGANDYDSIRVVLFRDRLPIRRTSQRLNYSGGKAVFDFTERIMSELREYTVQVIGHKVVGGDTIITQRDSLVCGDVYLISGQSNTVFPGVNNRLEYVRTFGVNYSQYKRDTLWSLGTAGQGGGGSTIGAWGLRLGELIMSNHHIPVCIINGGVGGTSIEQNSRNDAQPELLTTIYGSMLYRVRKSGLLASAKAMFWYQGESNAVTNYRANFTKLASGWRKDYPGLQKLYMVQIHTGCAAFSSHDQLRDIQRTMPTVVSDLEVMASAGLPAHDGCHYGSDGYTALGNQLYRLIDRDFYASTDTIAISSPDIRTAFFNNPSRTELALVFGPAGGGIIAQRDTDIGGVRSLRDHIYLSDSVKVTSIRTAGDTVFLALASASNATTVSYTPAVYYNGTQTIYEGPWLVNARGVGALTFAGVVISPKSWIRSDNPDSSTALVIRPNPASSTIMVVNGGGILTTVVDVVDQVGKRYECPVRILGDGALEIDIHSLGSGVYAVEVRGGDTSKVGWFVVRR